MELASKQEIPDEIRLGDPVGPLYFRISDRLRFESTWGGKQGVPAWRSLL